MVNVYDLHFKKEILPLFDYLYNEHSREMLVRVLTEMPASVEDIYLRQDILKALLQHEHLYVPISYSRVEFNQVYSYIEEKRVRGSDMTGVCLTIHFLFAASERNREKGGLYQLFYFLHKINQLYFSRLRTDVFPEPFREGLRNIQRMLSELQVEKYYGIARGRGLSLPETAHLAEVLQEKMNEGEIDRFWKDFFAFEAWYSISKGIHIHRLNFSFFFISTHLHQLEEVTGMDAVHACCIECDLEEGRPVFTYKLKPGWSDLKLGQVIFRQEGLDELLAGE